MQYDPDVPKECDVLVIGGGPAGSTAAARLSEWGWDVTVIEKDHHPRFHIGESLLPRNLPILEQLGVLEDVAQIALKKYGADLARPNGGEYRKFEFSEANPSQPHAFQVKRADFDHLLLMNAQSKGATVLQGTKVMDVSFDAEDAVVVSVNDDSGWPAQWRTKFVVDASGRDTFLATRLKAKRRDAHHNSAAVFAHFGGVDRRPGRDAGNTSVTWFEYGWFWTIPLSDGTDSVGVVCHSDYLRTRRTSLDQFLLDTIDSCPQMQQRMRHAKLLTEVHAAGNYSYKSETMYGDRYLLVGDAYAFLDPMFSTGVYLAMESAMQGATAIHRCLSSSTEGTRHLAAHAQTMERGLKRLSWFIYKFNTPAMQQLFMSRLNPMNMRRGVISLLAGDVFRSSKFGLGIPAFKLAHRFLSLVLRQPVAGLRAGKGRHNRANRIG